MTEPASEVMPAELRIFPLSGVLLLPGSRLPLHVFEPRYRHMVEDALASEPYIGMIQPLRPATGLSSEDGSGGDGENPALYAVGCAGHIERWKRLPDGRFVLLLKGCGRFRATEELDLVRGYRRVMAAYEEFDHDGAETELEVSSERLMEALQAFTESHQMTLELDKLGDLPGLALLNSIAMALPFAPAEKQALLEAPDVEHRHEMLLTLMDMGVEMRGDRPTVLH